MHHETFVAEPFCRWCLAWQASPPFALATRHTSRMSKSHNVAKFGFGCSSEMPASAVRALDPDDEQAVVEGKSKSRSTGKFIEGTDRIILERPRQSGNLMEDNRRKTLHLAITDIVSWCMAQPDHILSVQSMVKTGAVQSSDMKASVADTAEIRPFDKTYMNFGRLPKYWIVMFLARKFPRLTIDILRKVDALAKGEIRNIFDAFTGMTDNTKWPAQAKGHDVLWYLLSRVVDAVGPRDIERLMNAIDISGRIRWKDASPYRFSINDQLDEKVVVMTHITGLEVTLNAGMVPPTLEGLKQMVIEDAVHDRGAQLKLYSTIAM